MDRKKFERAKELDKYIKAIDSYLRVNSVGELYFNYQLDLISKEMGIHDDLLVFINDKRCLFQKEFDEL